ncbi:pro-neuregulin-1, membrane-bound isoform isoform X2 [Carassius auratus]|uniref:Pro-neuregulin-1, membrane-bound isoform n=1 Tax=Carassius auratus TaxID=7957 RepID=A0A6P6Q9X4_CARAU|nr:pro-neuregulin-1, membrane-bound isoform isoform X2 [Carassius auratus]
MRAIPSGRGSLSVSALCTAAVCLSLWTRVVRSGSLACSPPAASVQELARRAGVVFEGKLQEDARNGTESPVNASHQVRVRVQQVWQVKAGGLLKDSVVSLVWFEGGRCFQLSTGIRYVFFMEATNDTSVFTAVFPPVETKRTVRKDVIQVLCQDCVEPKLKELRGVTVEDGKKTVLRCEIVAGNPPPSIKWYKNGKELAGKNKPKSIKLKKKKPGKIYELLIRKSTEADAGLYTCEAVNTLGKANTTASLTIRKTATSTTPSAKTSSHVTRCSESERNFCVNGGECYSLEVPPGNIKHLCRCPSEFTGDRCQNYVMASFYKHLGIEFMAEELYQKRVLTITGICIALLVVGIMCVVAYCKTKKQRKKLHDRMRQSLRERNAAAKGPQHPHPPPENLQLVNRYMPKNTVPPHVHVMEKELETSLSTNEFASSTHASTAVSQSSSQCWSNGKAESVVSDSHAVLVKSSVENCRHGTPGYRGRLNATGGVHQLNDHLKSSCRDSPYRERCVSSMTSPSRLSPVGLLSPVTPSSPPSEMSAPLSSLATSVPSMAASPSGEEERPLLFRTPPILRDKSGLNQSGHNLRNSAHYNHGLELASPPHTAEQEESSQQHQSTAAASAPNSSRTQTALEPLSKSNSESSSSESETEDERVGEYTPFLGLQTPLAAGSVVLDGLEGSRTNPALLLSPKHDLQSRLTAVMANQDPIAV